MYDDFEFFWDKAWERGYEWDGVREMVKQELRNDKIHNLERRLQNVEDCVPFLSNIVSSHVPSLYESPWWKYSLLFTKSCSRSHIHVVATLCNIVDHVTFHMWMAKWIHHGHSPYRFAMHVMWKIIRCSNHVGLWPLF